MTSTKYIGMDVHKESISIAVMNASGKIGMECVIETKASMILQFFDGLRAVRQQVRRELLAEGKKHQAWKRLCQIPSIGPIRSAVLLGILQTPHRFRTKRQLWSYSGFGIETQSSADHRRVNGRLERAKKQSSIRGLNRNCNHDLKNVFKGAAIVASSKPGPFQEFYTALLTKGIRPEMARLTLARKIATIVLMVWKRGACFDAQHLKPQTA
jgi:transposase